MPTTSPEEQDDYPIEFMGERPPIDYLLGFNNKPSIISEANSENLCADTEE